MLHTAEVKLLKPKISNGKSLDLYFSLVLFAKMHLKKCKSTHYSPNASCIVLVLHYLTGKSDCCMLKVPSCAALMPNSAFACMTVQPLPNKNN